MWSKTSFTIELDNFWEKIYGVASPTFVSGGCEWYINILPKRHYPIHYNGLLDVNLYAANVQSLGTFWRRAGRYYYVVLNQSNKVLYRSMPFVFEQSRQSHAWSPDPAFPETLPFPKFQQTEFLEKEKLIIEVYIQVVQAYDGEDKDVSEKKKETLDFNGFRVFPSHVTLVRKIFAEHPDFAQDFKPKNQVVMTEYMNVLLGFMDTLNKPPHSLSETELSNAHNELSELTNVGFKLEWLKLKLEEVSLEGKKPDDTDGSRVQPLEEHDAKVEEVSLERKKEDDADGSRVQLLEERVKNLEMMELGFKLDSLNSKIEEVTLGVQQLEESVKNLEMMVSDLKVELDEEKAKSCADGFLLVNEVA